jgi:Ni/Co efflux regulator RcnB
MKKLLATTAIAATLFAAGSASAANWNQNSGHNNHSNNNSHYSSNNNWNHSQSQHPQMRHHGWHRGSYLPTQYRGYHEVDWHARHLRQPPRGYHWVQVDGDTVLVALAGGLILDALINN